jgi:predicted AlkP superfamily phosphohydrolase/phosphomutase
MNFQPSSSRVLVIGLDGATYDVLTPLAEMGVMPNLARFMRHGSLAELNSTRPFITPVAWTTFQTGCDPQQHGIWDYRYLDQPRRRLCLNDSSRILCRTIFDEVAAAGGEVVSLNLPMTFPPPSGVPGIIVGGLDSPSPSEALAPYEAFAAALRARSIPLSLDTIWKRVPETFEELSTNVERTRADFHGRAAAARLADSMTDWRLMIVQFQTLDAFQHRAWHLLAADGAAAAPQEWIEQARGAMRALDDAIGELLTLAEQRGAGVAIISDHGFGPFRQKISLPVLLVQRGLLERGGSAQRIQSRFQRIGWKTRKWIWRRMRPGASSSTLSRPLDALAPIDWRRSRAVALHGSLAAMIYLNHEARFGCGPLTSASEQQQATLDAIAALREAVHPQTGEALFDEVYSLQERFDCDPIERGWPDVLGIPADGFHTRTKFDAGRALVQNDATLTGTHRQQGVLMLSGRAANSALSDASPVAKPCIAELRDVAPTLLAMMGLPAGEQMTGRVLRELLTPVATQRRELPTNATQTAPDLAAMQSSEQETVEARLRDLGYLD